MAISKENKGSDYSTEQLMAYSEFWLENYIAKLQRENSELKKRLFQDEKKSMDKW